MGTDIRRSWVSALMSSTVAIVLLLLVGAGPAAAEWISIGPEGREISSLALNPQTPSTLYAGTDGGVFKSTNGGASWSTVNTGLSCENSLCLISALSINPRTQTALYTVRLSWRRGTTVFKSIDGGASWGVANTGLTKLVASALALDAQTPTTLYAGGWPGVFKSTDGGGHWSVVQMGPTTPKVRALALDPQTPTTLYAGGWPGVFKSTDGGASWSPVTTGLTNLDVWALALDPQTPTILYAGTGGDGVFKSTDGGGHWSAVNSGLTNLRVHALTVDPQTPTTVYAGTLGGVFKWTRSP